MLKTAVRGQLRFKLGDNLTKSATFAETLQNWKLAGFKELVITLNVISAERDSGNETYDIYIVTGDGTSTWDIVHFPQVATTGAKKFTARVLASRLANVTTAGPGVASEDTATMKTDTSGSNEGTKTLAAGTVRHGPFGDFIGIMGTIAGTVVTGINFDVIVTAGG